MDQSSDVWIQQPGHIRLEGQGQPTVVVTTGVVTSQPKRDWSTDLCSCCHDFKTCACATFCLCCLLGQITSRMGECCCVPCIPGGMMALRTKMRERYHIEGGICKDHCTMVWCGLCAICQMDRELNAMELQGQYCN